MQMKTRKFERRFGQRIKEERLARRLTQPDLAKQIGVNFRTISKYENGQRKISIGQAIVFANLFDFSLDEVLRG